MVAKVRLGRSFAQTVRYLFEGRKTEDEKQVDKRAELIGLNGVRRGLVAQIIADFLRQQSLNTDASVTVWHTALSFSEEDTVRLTNERMLQLSLLYMKKMGIDPKTTQWLLVRHGDRSHPHAHLVMNRVLAQGELLDTRFCNSRSRAVAVDIAREEKLTLSINKAKPKKLPHWQKRSPWNQAKSYVYKGIMQVLPEASHFADFSRLLGERNIEVITYPANEPSEDAIQGITFCFEQQRIKGCLVDRSLSWPKLKQKFAGQGGGLQPLMSKAQESVRPAEQDSPSETERLESPKIQADKDQKAAELKEKPVRKKKKLQSGG